MPILGEISLKFWEISLKFWENPILGEISCKTISFPIALILKLCSAQQLWCYLLSVSYNCRNCEPTVSMLIQNIHLNLRNTNVHYIPISSLLDFLRFKIKKKNGGWVWLSSQNVFCLGHIPKRYPLKHLFRYELTELLDNGPFMTNRYPVFRPVEKGTIR